MPPKKAQPSAPTPAASKQQKFRPPFLALLPRPAPQLTVGDSQSQSQSQQGDDEIATLGQILESMMKVSKDRRSRRRKEIEVSYRDGLAVVERKARMWLEGLEARENRRQLATLKKLKILLAKKQAIESDIIATMEAMEGTCESFGGALRRNTGAGLMSLREK